MGRIKTLLAEGKLTRVFGVGQFANPKLIEAVCMHGGFDGVWIDVEHAGLSMREVQTAVLAANAHGVDHFVRLPATDYASVMRALETGAGGVLISMIESPEDAERAVQWAKFAPRGQRGVNGGNRDGNYGLIPMAEYVQKANAETFVGVQIETASALDRVAEIAAVPDIDLVFVGPADLSQVLGVTGQFEDPKCIAALERISDACARAKKPWGVVARDPKYAQRLHAMGCTMFVLAFDMNFLHAGVRQVKEIHANFFA